MKNSIIEQDFMNWCYSIHPDINPYLFIRRHTRYSEEYLPLLEKNMTKMYHYISEKNPNVNFSLKGRIKSKRSYLIKSYIQLCQNIEKTFSSEQDEKEREKSFEKFFKFLLNENPEKYKELKNKMQAITPALDYADSFLFIFNKLSKEEKDKLITRLGRTEDTFAYRLIINSVDFPIQSITYNSSDAKYYIIDQDGYMIPINKAITINPKKDLVYSDETNKTYLVVNGKRQTLNERNLLYSRNIPTNQRTLPNAQKDKNGNITLLTDALIIENERSPLDIVDIQLNPTNNCIFITDSKGDVRNLSALLEERSITLRKYDEKSLIEEVYNISDTKQTFYEENNLQFIWSRYKNYIETPKEKTGYMSLHDSAVNKLYGYTIEGQSRTLEMEDHCKDESVRVGHDAYKREKAKLHSNNKFLAKILAIDPNAFDSSTPVLMDILENRNVELTDLLGKYILTTTMNNGSVKSWQPPIDVVFEHTFQNATSYSSPDQNDDIPSLDFSSYENFIMSKRNRHNAQNKECHFLDIYDDD